MKRVKRGLSEMRGDFSRPGAGFRSVPFWGWNDRLSASELAAQVEWMKSIGLGGFFIHSRDGLEIPYLGNEWMESVRAAVEKARELGMDAWIYDEDRWPSGFAGGRVPAGGDAFRAKGLTVETDAQGIPPDALAAYIIAGRDGERIDSFRRLPVRGPAAGPAAGPGESLIVAREEISAPSPWFNNEAPPDNLNPDCVDEFLRVTHEAYLAAVGQEFGGTVKGFFYDEPGVHDRHASMTKGRGWIPWTTSFPAFFKGRRGYDFLDVAPLLFFRAGGYRAARHDFWRTLTELFSRSFSERIGAWCARHGVAATGHFLWENDLGVATRVCGAVMPNYRHQDVPGIDVLGLADTEVITVKQCASVANQLGRQRVISEMYGGSGWGLSFEEQKRQGDWQFVLGVNMRCQHHLLSSLRGCRKRDYPPSFNYHAPWAAELPAVEDYFARLSSVLTEGTAVRKILVVHPASTAWSRLGSDPDGFASRGRDRDMPGLRRHGDELNALLRLCVEEHYDCDLGDETILGDIGRVDHNGNAGAELVVGLGRYRLVVLHCLDSLLSTTFGLLRSFSAAGGRILIVGSPPSLIEGRPSAALVRFTEDRDILKAPDAKTMISALERALPRWVSIAGGTGGQERNLWALRKDTGEIGSLFIVNRDGRSFRDLDVSVEGEGVVEEWDPLSGRKEPADAVSSAGRTVLPLSIGPYGSRLFIIDRSRTSRKSGFARKHPARQVLAAVLGPEPRIEARMPNALVLDTCELRIEEGPWSETMDIWAAQDLLRESLGMRPFTGIEAPQRYTWARDPHPMDGKEASFRFRFQARERTSDGVCLAVEGVEDLIGLSVNGAEVPRDPKASYLDRAIQTIPLPAPVVGDNEIVLRFSYRNGTEVEDCAVIGDFGVDTERRLYGTPGAIRFGDWCLQGFPNYPGALTYCFDLEVSMETGAVYELELGARSAVHATVDVNGRRAVASSWAETSRIDVTEALRGGQNLIEVTLHGSPRNFFGPLRRAAAGGSPIDWSAFRPRGADRLADHSLVPYGLQEPPKLFKLER